MNHHPLAGRLRGTVIPVFHPGYAAAADALVWNGRKPQKRTRLIVKAACVADVQEAVRFAAAERLTVTPRCGGHHFTGIAAEADVVVDVSALDGLRIDAAGRLAEVGPAVTNARLAAALARHELAFPVGHCGSVPMGGYLLGGGIGWNSGAWNVACFSLAEAEIVLPDGSLVRASEEENPDLFWAVRGAGPGFFGIVTAFRLRLQPAPKAITTAVRIFPPSAVAAVAAWAEAAMERAPACVEFTVKVGAMPPGAGEGLCLAAISTVFAESEEAAQAIQDRLAIGAPEALMAMPAGPTPFDTLYALTAPSMPEGQRYAVDSLWSDGSFAKVLSGVLDGMTAAPSGQSFALVVLRAAAAVMPGEAAFSRIGRVFGVIYGIWADAAEDAAQTGWLRATMAGLSPLATGAYVGECDLDLPERRLATHTPAVRARLATLRARFDPSGLFPAPLRPATDAAA